MQNSNIAKASKPVQIYLKDIKNWEPVWEKSYEVWVCCSPSKGSFAPFTVVTHWGTKAAVTWATMEREYTTLDGKPIIKAFPKKDTEAQFWTRVLRKSTDKKKYWSAMLPPGELVALNTPTMGVAPFDSSYVLIAPNLKGNPDMNNIITLPKMTYLMRYAAYPAHKVTQQDNKPVKVAAQGTGKAQTFDYENLRVYCYNDGGGYKGVCVDAITSDGELVPIVTAERREEDDSLHVIAYTDASTDEPTLNKKVVNLED